MQPSKHIFFGAIFSLLIFLFFRTIGLSGFLILFLSTFMIDFDHYLYYIFRKKNINPLKAYRWYIKNRNKFHSLPRERMREVYGGVYVFHGLEQLFVLFIVGFFLYKPILFVFTGFLFHLLLDWYEELQEGIPPIKFLFILDIINSRKLKHIEAI